MHRINKIILLYIFKRLPLTRCFKFKTKLLNYTGMNVNSFARIVSSVSFLGTERIKIGFDTFIGHEVLIGGSKNSQIMIGNNIDIGPRVTLITGTHKIDLDGEHIAGEGIGKDIVINDGAWIGMGSLILPGVTIGEKSIVAAGSVVLKDVPPYTLVAGNPAVIKKRLKNVNI